MGVWFNMLMAQLVLGAKWHELLLTSVLLSNGGPFRLGAPTAALAQGLLSDRHQRQRVSVEPSDRLRRRRRLTGAHTERKA